MGSLRAVVTAVVSALIASCFVTFGAARAAEPRVALVVGNGGYAYGSLPNPVNDAELIADALDRVGFDVVKVIDADQREMKREIVDFGERLAAAGPTAVGLFYYAGHGVQANGQNYLIPIGADLRRVADLDIEAVEADWALLQMREAGNAVNFLILDACRDNPLPRGLRASIGGLARMDAPVGTFVAYATAPGATAEDGAGSNSPYTTALAEMLKDEGVPAEILFRNVRNRVIELTEGRQVPWDSSSLRGGDFCFAACQSNADAGPGSTVDADGARPAEPVEHAAPDHAVELAYWDTIKDSDDAASFEAYLADFPDGQFARLARVKIASLQEADEPETEPVDTGPAEPLETYANSGANSGAGSSGKPGAAAAGAPQDPVQAIVDLLAGRWTGTARTLDFMSNTWNETSSTLQVTRTGPATVQLVNGASVSTTYYQGRAFASDIMDNSTGMAGRVEGGYSRIEGPDEDGDFETEAFSTLMTGYGAAFEMRDVVRYRDGVLTADTYLRPLGATQPHILAEQSEFRRAGR